MLKFRSNIFWLIVAAAVLILGGVLLFFVHEKYQEKALKERQQRLESFNDVARFELEEALSNYSLLLAGIRSYIHNSDEMPTAEQLQSFIKQQNKELANMETFVISYVDTSHVFKYSFTLNEINPTNLVGTSIRKIVGNAGIRNLNKVKQSRDFFAFNPFNTVEGFVGIPLDFGIVKNEKSLGYITAVTDFKPIIDRVYDANLQEEFVFNFRTARGHDFDRKRVYDGSTVHNTIKDPEYYKNYEIDPESFIYSDASFYNIGLEIGLAYKNPYKPDTYITYLLSAWYGVMVLLLILVVSQIQYYRKVNRAIDRQRQELATTVADKNKFFSIIAHDLRSPLAYIIALMNILKTGSANEGEQTNLLLKLKDHTKNTLNLLDNLLTWARVQTSSMNFNPEPFNIIKLIKETCVLFDPAIQEKELQLQFEDTAEVLVMADQNMIATVLRNILSNAIKFTPQKGLITISIQKLNNKVTVSIHDNGIGVEQEHLAAIFNIATSKTRLGTNAEKGTGLGLVLCKEFVEKNNGTIWVESKENIGSTFSFSLPITEK
ncbi:sensor histidine kinase [Spongiivirga citrea]|uniref:histidine kinase n=1 Tax=Spongiivirga citrea TaxID=1481457 RepID=A0A6M0CH93_9FLAO|nr:HAMP domain-containing sensor histidine kinase [Spongiivirga citrea]NER17205.1 GHKL domain-containing protein [Spongiivirga citrea]